MKVNEISKKQAVLDRVSAEKKLIEALKILRNEGYKEEEILKLIKKPTEGIPVSIFANDELSCLESIVKFLKENKESTFTEIASLLNRNHRTIWTTYSNSNKKRKSCFAAAESDYYIPFEIFKNRNIGVLENICLYLKDICKLSFHQIAVLLRRNDRTIWTSYHKAKNKVNK